VKQWVHVKQLYINREQLFEVLLASRHHVKSTVHSASADLESALTSLCKSIVSHGPWERQIIAVLSEYWLPAQQLDIRLSKISPIVLRAIHGNMDLVEWLRTVRDDEAFSNR
jgi:hypothetical protein